MTRDKPRENYTQAGPEGGTIRRQKAGRKKKKSRRAQTPRKVYRNCRQECNRTACCFDHSQAQIPSKDIMEKPSTSMKSFRFLWRGDAISLGMTSMNAT